MGNPLADLLQPDLTYLVNWGYGDPDYGYSTAPANVPTPFGLFPPLSATTALPSDLILGVPQGISAAARDVIAEGTSALAVAVGRASLSSLSLSGIIHSLSSISLPSPGTLLSPASIDNFILSLQAGQSNVANVIGNVGANVYGVLLPTTDILTATVTALPAYDATFFLNGISQVASGDPMGLINAVGYPIAATAGVLTVLGGIEGLVLVEGAANVVKDFTGLIP